MKKKYNKRLFYRIKKLEQNKIREAIDKLIESQESNPKIFYTKMRGENKQKRGIEEVMYEENGIINITKEGNRVKKVIMDF